MRAKRARDCAARILMRRCARRLATGSLPPREWVAGLDPSKFGTHSLRCTKPVLIYRRTGNLRSVQLLLVEDREHRSLPRHRGRWFDRDRREDRYL